jgi:hypothetical protein
LIPDLDVRPLTEAAGSTTFLPRRGGWAEQVDELGVRLPYLVLRVLCLRRDWREFATVLYKCHYSVTVLAECDEEL